MKDKRLFFLLNRAQHLLLKRADAELMSRLGISCVQMGALLFLKNRDGCLLKELSEGLALNNSAITGLASRMVSADLIEKRPCAKDGRAYRVFLTPVGLEKLRQGMPLVNGFNRLLKADFDEQEILVVLRFLNKAIDIALAEKEENNEFRIKGLQ